MSKPKRLSLKKRLSQELTLWVLFAIDSECLSQGLLLPLPLAVRRPFDKQPEARLGEQLETWRNDDSIWRIGFSHIKNKTRLQQIWSNDGLWQTVEKDIETLLLYQSALDSLLSRSAIRWKLNRMGSIDRSILRLGVYELYFKQDIPVRAILSEAIELGKRYGSADSGRFINGVLDKVAQEIGRIERRENNDVKVSVVRRKR
ncbi:MAG: transcription antitermination factor NusB [Myxococcales bacterium]|nr:transcription antitermination factor NusB [Myxococcales bacterium]